MKRGTRYNRYKKSTARFEPELHNIHMISEELTKCGLILSKDKSTDVEEDVTCGLCKKEMEEE